MRAVLSARWTSAGAAAVDRRTARCTSGWTSGRHPLRRQIPPEYATQEHRVINGRASRSSALEAQKTPEQLAEEDQKKLDAAARADRDKNLLNTYVSVQEIERLRDQRLTLLSDQIKVTSQFLDMLNGELNKLRVTSMRFKPYSDDPKAPPMPDQMAEDLVRVGNDIRTQEENLREKRSEEAA